MKKRLLIIIITVLFTISTGQTVHDTTKNEPVKLKYVDSEDVEYKQLTIKADKSERKENGILDSTAIKLQDIEKNLR